MENLELFMSVVTLYLTWFYFIKSLLQRPALSPRWIGFLGSVAIFSTVLFMLKQSESILRAVLEESLK